MGKLIVDDADTFRVRIIYESEDYEPYEVLSFPKQSLKPKPKGTGLRYEDIQVGDWVAVVTAQGDIDLERFGKVTGKLEKSNYAPMKVIDVQYHRPPVHARNPEGWAPMDLIKLPQDMKDHLIKNNMTDVIRNYRTFKEVK